MKTEPLILASLSILIIEDEIVFRKQLESYLQDLGASVQTADSGVKGIEAIELHQPDIILTDLNMPGMDGHAVLEAVLIRYPGLPVIVISGLEDMSDVARSMRLGAFDYLHKPITDWSYLLEAVTNAQAEIVRESQSCLSGAEFSLPDLGYAQMHESEFENHLRCINASDIVSSSFIRDLMPQADTDINGIVFDYRTTDHLLMLDYVRLDKEKVGLVVFDLSLLAGEAVLGSLLLTYLISKPFRDYKSNNCGTILNSSTFLKYLNSQLHSIHLPGMINVFYGIIDKCANQMEWSCAGLTPRIMGQDYDIAGLPLGMLANTCYVDNQYPFDDHLNLFFSGENGGGLSVNIQCSD